MSNEALDPLLRRFAEKRLGRPLEPGEEQALLERLPSRHANQPAPTVGTAATQAHPANPPLPQPKTRQEAREQIKHFLQLNQQKAYEKMRGILQTIDAQNETTLGMLASEQRKVSGVLDAHEPPADAQASGAADIQDSTREAMALIGEQLTGLIRQEIDACFRQYVDLLTVRLDAIYDRLQSIGATTPESPESTAPDAAATAVVHDTPGPASM
ncbi:hypothetical protein CH72_326 [Burkholderia ambifaria AMMD]|uniref:Uncharacterized protein n=1 Tax=Burkholderia ambifaria (strain ATCC BAA-244 / DSM 16087 / CCUG 44356 / LMG 19182 / AMMD) TaxID=339670 RepID=Q0BGF5_BURCM|nr:hypothetical protein [Burkholderia ambifaria]ABI86768.1 conserved hypothetical protein [Burkholderia ambifaria AMMD]AJY21362.1 hypothetical protein CH72_326 [Burkholderia ambifaria AMMD]MBR7929610.1 hypothetical protein [Burkholderia ambifaria]PEH65963.1 hypothetical protein CRM91_27080 [Burkholderia ambifaria]QQC02912.1 hypothetical protein I6H84_08870 [Burkholderia ambifaria]